MLLFLFGVLSAVGIGVVLFFAWVAVEQDSGLVEVLPIVAVAMVLLGVGMSGFGYNLGRHNFRMEEVTLGRAELYQYHNGTVNWQRLDYDGKPLIAPTKD